MKVIITNDVDVNYFGIDELIESLGDVSIEDRDAAIVEILQDDPQNLFDGATWRIEE